MKKLALGILMSTVSAIGYSQTTQYKYKVNFYGDTILAKRVSNLRITEER
ncbi:hypothetical protein GJU39_03565 [Pedobacter petrophilus]|uniref:Uncharacterized protein n=1 Tax=Pedobacter petrophilus TaxID=1908241 RepID=A0A7K0FU69_9SPHI|nr:hypothetical protein [Pedobacter petrophilus]MRX75157.1 hypothetical protein [Pedobacter petrophilus]